MNDDADMEDEGVVWELPDEVIFPPVESTRADGLLAVGGDLTVERLRLAYQSGIFPWPIYDDILTWFSPDPRCVLFPDKFKVSKSLQRTIKNGKLRVSFDDAFEAVIKRCRSIKRNDEYGTWVTEDICSAYCDLHRAGDAHSVEVWEGDQLVGGLYGVEAGKCFCGESMFSEVSDASKVALAALVDRLKERGFKLIDCQVANPHLVSMGAEEISRKEFLSLLSACGVSFSL